MNEQRRVIEQAGSLFEIRNTPLRPRARLALLERPDTAHFETPEGELILTVERGQHRLYWGFNDREEMRRAWGGLWAQVKARLEHDGHDYVAMDIAGLTSRDWLLPLFDDADFLFFAEWLEMTHPALNADAIPEFPEGVTMRRATPDDLPRLQEIWTESHGDYGDGDATWAWIADTHAWAGVLEDEDGDIVAFAANGPVERNTGEVLAAAVAPEAWGNGYGRLVLAAATYQLASNEAVTATIRVRPDIRNALRTCSETGFRHTLAGVEFRRTLDEAAIVQRREERKRDGVKARFGKWR